ncbi:MAG: hypothetical protein V4663_01880 [Bacteroidota bacterium]
MTSTLQVFTTIKGISAASGLFLKGNLLYLIADNSNYLYEYDIKEQRLNKLPLLVTSPPENIPKADKPDFEVVCGFEGSLYILGSGSTVKRNRMIEYRLGTKKVIEHDLLPLYTAMKKAHAVDDDNLNIEGAIFTGDQWFLFNRGNGNSMKNGIFIIKGPDLANAKSADFISIALLKTNEVFASFTDAVLYQNQIYFIAAAEDTTSTYNDGKILGSYIGSLDLATLKLNYIKKIAEQQKFEGLTFLREKGGQIEFLICEDSDTDTTSTIIYKYGLTKS